jgi:hypothetical protein
LLAAGVLLLGLAASGAIVEKKDPSIKEIMTRAHKGARSLLTQVGGDLKETSPAWTDARSKTRELVGLATTLGKRVPPRGERKSWTSWTNRYLVGAKVLDASIARKDRKNAQAALAQLRTLCAGCHREHRKE